MSSSPTPNEQPDIKHTNAVEGTEVSVGRTPGQEQAGRRVESEDEVDGLIEDVPNQISEAAAENGDTSARAATLSKHESTTSEPIEAQVSSKDEPPSHADPSSMPRSADPAPPSIDVIDTAVAEEGEDEDADAQAPSTDPDGPQSRRPSEISREPSPAPAAGSAAGAKKFAAININKKFLGGKPAAAPIPVAAASTGQPSKLLSLGGEFVPMQTSRASS